MAPEQARGSSSIDHRADIWAACVVVYECVTAQPAFEGDNYNALMRAIIEQQVKPITELAAGDASLWAVLDRGLKKDPSERWQTAAELGAALAEWLLAHGIDTDIAGEPVRNWLEPDSSKSRDLLSVPPPASATLQSDRSGLALTKGDALTQAPPSFRPSPESTSAVVRTTRPQLFRTGMPFIAAVVLLVVGAAVLITLVTRRHAVASGSASSPVVAAPSPPPEFVAPPAAVPAPAAVTPAPAAEPVNDRSALQSAPAQVKVQPLPRGPRRAPQKSTVPPGNKSGADLKDPY
jgi:serine/threonine-protein kinase